jgi:hypothetical protein
MSNGVYSSGFSRGGQYTSKNCQLGGCAAVYCCDSVFSNTRTILNPLLDTLASDLAAFASSPICPADIPTAISKSAAGFENETHESWFVTSLDIHQGEERLLSRDATSSYNNVVTAFADIIKALISGNSNPWVNSEESAWVTGMSLVFSALAVLTSLAGFLNTWTLSNLAAHTPADLAGICMCNPYTFDRRIGGSSTAALCNIDACTYTNCLDPEDEDGFDPLTNNDYDDSALFYKRSLYPP